MGFPAVIDKRAEREKYGETKKQKQFMLTESASHILDRLAFDRRVTRSEAIEQLIREEAERRELSEDWKQESEGEGALLLQQPRGVNG